MQQYKQEWFGNIRGDILAGIVVCLALFPEVIGFMIVAGVPPIVGVYALFSSQPSQPFSAPAKA